MKALADLRLNIFYTKELEEGKEVFKKKYELVFLLSHNSYKISNARDVVRESSITENRFTVDENGIDTLIEVLTAFKKTEPKDLT